MGFGGSAPSTGSIAGSLAVHDSRATFAAAKSGCDLDVAFYGVQVVVEQAGRCGFGNGVTAAGRYRKL